MPWFTPPAGPDMARYDMRDKRSNTFGYRLFRHIKRGGSAINVWIVNGTVTTVTPAGDDYPTATEFLGGHGAYYVTDEQAALLTAAGYSVEAE